MHVDLSLTMLVDFLIYLIILYSSVPLLQALSKGLTEDELFYLRFQFNLLQPNKDGHIFLENFRMVSMSFFGS